jgi:glycosyltransferase involved in cell wall biosynthesis
MRVAHILRKYVPAEWGGTETALQRLTEGLGNLGVASTVYYPRTDARIVDDPLAATGCELHPFDACVPIWGLSPEARRLLTGVGGNLLSFDLPRRLAGNRSVDVIHSHVLGRIGGIAMTVARRRHVPFVVSIHGGALDLPGKVRENLQSLPRQGVEWGRLFGWWWRSRHLLAEADAIVTCNQREADLIRAQHPAQRVVVQPHGVDTKAFGLDHRAAATRAFPAIAGRDLLVQVARIDPVKNQLWLVQRLPRLVARHPRLLLVLAGASTDAGYEAELIRAIRHLGLENHVLLTGGLPPASPEVIGLMQLARAVVLASLAETFGLVIIEAWAAGSCMLASRTTGASALIRDGENGELFGLDDPEEFLAKTERVLADDTYCARLAAAGRRSTAAYDITALAGRLRDVYTELQEEKNALRNSA